MGAEDLTIAWTDQASRRRRIRIERRSAGGWDRHVEEFSGGQWRPVGREIVADLDVEVGNGVLDAVDVVGADGAAGATVRGPEGSDR